MTTIDNDIRTVESAAMENIRPVLLANSPDCLAKVCGISHLERLLRILQRLDFRRVTVVSTDQAVAAELAKPSWAREKVVVDLAERVPENSDPLLIVPANLYCDARLLAALCAKDSSARLVDSNPPEFVQSPCGPILEVSNSDPDDADAATVDDYIVGMRRHVRPVCFRASENVALAERVILDSAQKGTLDIPARVHAPIEKWIVSHLCKTSITPNQITLFGFVLGLGATIEFATGHIGWALLSALIFGVVDGLDGKQARVKVETTERGEWEHQLDFVIENSWWVAMAFWLWRSGDLPGAFYFLALLFGSNLVDVEAKRRAKVVTGRLIDDVAPVDRAFRLIGARRNINIWMLAASYIFGAFRGAYIAICVWAGITAAFHVVRAISICRSCKQ